MIIETKFRAGKFLKPVKLNYVEDRIQIKFGYNKILIAEIKAMQGARWDPDNKFWHIPNTQRNQFQLAYLQGKNPYARYDAKLADVEATRPLYDHQIDMLRNVLTRHYIILAAEMGTGKTLVAIEAMERMEEGDVWYVGPRSGVKAVTLELMKWDCRIQPDMMTYDGMKKTVKYWKSGTKAPRMVIFDESSKLKTPTSQQSQYGLALADGVRKDWGDDGYVILMTGTPAPKSPMDWYQQCEVACPGFLKEGDIHKFRRRMAVIEERENLITGGTYPHLMGWKDGRAICDICGKPEPHYEDHPYTPAKNEVANLYDRMNGLVMVLFKKDCLDLPEKQYIEVMIKPTPDLLRTAAAIKAVASRAIEALTLLRELSDGFQYEDQKTGEFVPCPRCKGLQVTEVKKPVEAVDPTAPNTGEIQYETVTIPCETCGGHGEVPQIKRGLNVVGSPKDDQLILDLEDHEEVGRLVIWGGFTGSIDRIVDICQAQKWATLRVDGRGYVASDDLDADELLIAMDKSHPRYEELLEKHPLIAFVGHPKAGGMALTLTASPTAIYYSNDFSGEGRMQSEDRIHRAGMDINRGCAIKDYIHLPTDKYVLDNLKKKKDLQKVSMGDLD